MGKAKEVHWHGLRSFRVVIRRVPESSPQSSSPRHTTTLRPLVEMYPLSQDASIGCVRFLPSLSPLPFIDAENQKSLGLSSSSSRGVCVRDNRISSKSDHPRIQGWSRNDGCLVCESMSRWISLLVPSFLLWEL